MAWGINAPRPDSARRAWGINAPPARFCPQGVGALGGYDGSDLARSGSKTHRRNPPDTPSRRELPLVPSGSSASRTPTGSAQNQNPRHPRSQPTQRAWRTATPHPGSARRPWGINAPRPDSARRAWGINATPPRPCPKGVGNCHTPVRFCPQGVGALGGYDGSDLARSGSKTHRRNPPDTPSRRALPLVPGGSSASRTPTGTAQNQKRLHRYFQRSFWGVTHANPVAVRLAGGGDL
jgi:hypothetical protein